MQSNFSRSIAELLLSEGGYVDHPKDPGGATNFGITHRTLAAERGVVPWTKLPKDEVKNLTKAEAIRIYEKSYWKKTGGDLLPSGLDYFTFDFGVNAGPARSVMMLQNILGVPPDGTVGPITTTAAEKANVGVVLLEFRNRRQKYYESLATFKTFGKGWTTRNNHALAVAQAMVNGAPIPAPPVSSWFDVVWDFIIGLINMIVPKGK